METTLITRNELSSWMSLYTGENYMRDEELFKNKTDEMIESFIEKCEKEAAKLEITVDYYIKEFVVDF